MGQRYIFDKEKGKVVPIEEYDNEGEHYHYIITDETEPMRHPCNGLYYTSKSNFRKTTQAHGCIEIGNEKLEKKESRLSKSDRLEDIKKVLHKEGLYRI